MQLAFGTIIGRILVSYIFIKPYYDYKVFSIYEYLTARFGVASKNAASAVFMITRLLASGARLYVAAIALALAYEMISGARPNQTQTLWIYVGATIAIVILTAIYTTLGGIKAVIWTDLIQASIMIGSALIALGLLYSAIPGGWHEIVERHGPFKVSDLIATGLDPARHGWDKVERHVRDGVHDLCRLDRGGVHHDGHTRHGSGHGAANVNGEGYPAQPPLPHSAPDSPTSRSRSRFSASGYCCGFTIKPIPIRHCPKTPNETFCHFILYQMPVGLRGLLLAGIFATAMGSLSTALNALATSFTRDWYEPYINPGATDAQSLRAVRWATIWFSVLMIIVASTTSYLVIVHPNVRIIPIVLGIFGYTYGSLLGVFFAGMLTKTRGNDRGNIIAMIIGFLVVAILSGLPNNIAGIFGAKFYTQPGWLPVMEFPWWIFFGTLVTFAVAVLFPSHRPISPRPA